MIRRLFSPVCLTISILLLVYIFYRSEIHWNGAIRDIYFIYYLISGSLILFSIITFYLNDEVKTYLIITLTSFVFVIYLFEAYLTFKVQVDVRSWKLNEKIILYKQHAGKDYDTRTKFEIYNDLKKEDENITVSVIPSHYIGEQNKIFPLSGVSNSKTIHCNENGYYSIYLSDRYGFNNPDSEWDEQEIEYLLVGDSFTHGACVNRPNDIASVLRTLSKKSVLNLGYSGDGPLIEYAALREYLRPNVKNILWVYFDGNDMGDLDAQLNSEILTRYLKDLKFTQNLKTKQNQIDELTIQRIKESGLFSLEIFKFIKIYGVRSKVQKYFQPQPQIQPQFKEILELTKDLSIKNNSKLYFVYLPDYLRYKIKYDTTFYNQVKQIVKKLNIPFIDIHQEIFEKESNSLKLFPFELQGHYNVEGYRKTAETIYKFISK